MYTKGEAVLGEALSSWKGTRPVVNTKTLRSPDVLAVRERFEESERALGTVDMLAVHDAEPDYPSAAVTDTVGFVRELLDAGRIRAAGQGGGGPVVQSQWLPNGPFGYVITHLRLDAVSLQALDDLVPLAERLGAAVFAASPLHLGLLGSNYRVFSEYPQQRLPEVMVERARTVKRLADEWAIPLTHLGLRFVLSLPMVNVVISGAVTPEEWADCQAAYEAGPLPIELYEAVWKNACQGAEPLVGG
jgi:aryl-alcohol dehydrogenase-like predicted oxidoreductase